MAHGSVFRFLSIPYLHGVSRSLVLPLTILGIAYFSFFQAIEPHRPRWMNFSYSAVSWMRLGFLLGVTAEELVTARLEHQIKCFHLGLK